MLTHLAEHARTEAINDHLRTCRCHVNGCTWHRRHRGCTGPIQLVLFHRQAGRQWTLADICTACAYTIPHAAQVPSDGPAAAGPSDGRTEWPPAGAQQAPPLREHLPPPEAGDQVRPSLLAALRYLEAALEPPTAPAARILALICLLRADATGAARLPRGLLRALHLAHQSDLLLDALAGQRWLHIAVQPPGQHADPPGGGVAVRIADLMTGAALPGTTRNTRRCLLDRAARLLAHPGLRALDDETRLAALYLAADPGRTQRGTTGQLTTMHRSCSPEKAT